MRGKLFWNGKEQECTVNIDKGSGHIKVADGTSISIVHIINMNIHMTFVCFDAMYQDNAHIRTGEGGLPLWTGQRFQIHNPTAEPEAGQFLPHLNAPKLTYAQLGDAIAAMTDEQRQANVTVEDAVADECYPAELRVTDTEHGSLDDDHPVLWISS